MPRIAAGALGAILVVALALPFSPLNPRRPEPDLKLLQHPVVPPVHRRDADPDSLRRLNERMPLVVHLPQHELVGLGEPLPRSLQRRPRPRLHLALRKLVLGAAL